MKIKKKFNNLIVIWLIALLIFNSIGITEIFAGMDSSQMETEIEETIEPQEPSEIEEAADTEESLKTIRYEASIEGFSVEVVTNEASFNEPVSLQVKEGAKNVEDALNEPENVKEFDEELLQYIEKNNLSSDDIFLDISFENEHGEKVEPQNAVEVTIKIDQTLIDLEDEENLPMITHYVEDESGKIDNVEVVATPGGDIAGTVEIDEKEQQIVATFQSESFSWYNVATRSNTSGQFNVYFAYVKTNEDGQYTYISTDNSFIQKDVIADANMLSNGRVVRGRIEFGQQNTQYNGTTTPFNISNELEYVDTVLANSNSGSPLTDVTNGTKNIAAIMASNVSSGTAGAWHYYQIGASSWTQITGIRHVYSLYRRKDRTNKFHAVIKGEGYSINQSLDEIINNWDPQDVGEFDFDAGVYNGWDSANNRSTGAGTLDIEEKQYNYVSAYMVDGDGNKIELSKLNFHYGDNNIKWKYIPKGSSTYIEIDNFDDYEVYIEYEDGIEYNDVTAADASVIDLGNGQKAYVYYVNTEGKALPADKITISDEVAGLANLSTCQASVDLYTTSVDGYRSRGVYLNSTSFTEDSAIDATIKKDTKNGVQRHYYTKDGAYTADLKDGDVIYVVHERDDRINDTLTPVNTVDNTALGFKLYMFDYSRAQFAKQMESGNEYTSDTEEKPRGSTVFDIYSSTVGSDGFPTVGDGTSSWFDYGAGYFLNGNYSLGDLLNPDGPNSSIVVSSQQVNNLFLKSVYDETGHLYFSSEENAAELNTSTGKFTVYEELAAPRPRAASVDGFFYRRGNFMPYNHIDPTSQDSNYTNLYSENGAMLDASYVPEQDAITGNTHNQYNAPIYTYQEASNYYFGMYGTMNFYQPKNGQVNVKNSTTGEKEDMIFQFTGDDDMVVYIDGVLVLDLGGIHDAQSGTINFRTGEVTYTTTQPHAQGYTVHTTTIREMFEEAGAADLVEWNGNTLDDGSYHCLQFFYMERGAGASNLKIDVNIPPAPDNIATIQKNVSWNEQGNQDRTQKFRIKVETKKPEETSYRPIAEGTTYTLIGDSTIYAVQEEGYIELEDGQIAKFEGLEAGTIVRISEELTEAQASTFWDPGYASSYELGTNNAYVHVPSISGEVQLDKTLSLKVLNLEDTNYFDVVKVDAASANIKLKDATFELWRVDSSSQTSIPYVEGVKGELVGEKTTGTEGRIRFSKLAIGNYYLVETSPPTGYMVNAKVIPIEVTADGVKITENAYVKLLDYTISTGGNSGADDDTRYVIPKNQYGYGANTQHAVRTEDGSTEFSSWSLCINGQRATPTNSKGLTNSYIVKTNPSSDEFEDYLDTDITNASFDEDSYKNVKRVLYWYLTSDQSGTNQEIANRIMWSITDGISLSNYPSAKEVADEILDNPEYDDIIDARLTVQLLIEQDHKDVEANSTYDLQNKKVQNMVTAKLSGTGRTIQVANSLSEELPNTGGRGIYPMLLMGSLFLLAAAFLSIRKSWEAWRR